jgi:hypothetical protein
MHVPARQTCAVQALEAHLHSALLLLLVVVVVMERVFCL